MAKRYTETSKWQDDWFLSLTNDYRVIWQYLLDNCSIAGIWRKGFKALNYFCNTSITEEEFKQVFAGRVIDLNTFFFIPKFLKHQYPSGLISEKPLIISVMKEVSLNNLQAIIVESLGNDYPIIKVTGNGNNTGKGKKKQVRETGKAEAAKIETPDLIFPYSTESFLQVWNVLTHEKKWRNKSHAALQAALKKLSHYSEADAIQMMNDSITGEWQGLFELKNNNHKNGNTNSSAGTPKPWGNVLDHIKQHAAESPQQPT